MCKQITLVTPSCNEKVYDKLNLLYMFITIYIVYTHGLKTLS